MEKAGIIFSAFVILLTVWGGVFQTTQENQTSAVKTLIPTISAGSPITYTTIRSLDPAKTFVEDTFPNALNLKQIYRTGSDVGSFDVTVYKYRIYDSYHWYNPEDNQFFVNQAPLGKKYLIIFISLIIMNPENCP